MSFFSAYAKKEKIAVEYFDTEDLELKETEMYISGYKAKLEKDTSYVADDSIARLERKEIIRRNTSIVLFMQQYFDDVRIIQGMGR